MFISHVTAQDEPYLFLGLSPEGCQELASSGPVKVSGAPVGLPHMCAVLLVCDTRDDVIKVVRDELMIGGDWPDELSGSVPIRAYARIGEQAQPAILLGLTAADVAALAAGQTWHIDGSEGEMPEMRLCVTGVPDGDLTNEQKDQAITASGAQKPDILLYPELGMEFRLHPHQPPQVAMRGLTLRDVYHAGQRAGYALCTPDRQITEMWKGGTGYGCCPGAQEHRHSILTS